ncbi:MAG: CoA transferase, partial [Chloroflexia bacterium]
WRQLGVERAGLELAWGNFVYRYLAASCTLPVSLHEATALHTLDELRGIAEPLGIAILVVRGYSDLLDEIGLSRGGGLKPRGERSLLHPEAPWAILAQTEHRAEVVEQHTIDATKGPLAGMRVVEVSSRLQGPLAGLLLQMLGAEVVKVEPIGGDFGRYAPPKAGSQGAAYMAYNRGKRVVEIDYKSEEGCAQMLDLIGSADVFLHNWRSGRAEKTGFDFESFARINPRLVYAHASGWGRIEDEPSPIAGDFLVQAHAATGEGLNPVDEPPFPSRVTLVDVTGGLLACEGILAGLYLREQTGQGCRVDTSLFSAAMELQADVLKAIALDQEEGREWGRPVWGTLARPIETADGFVMVSAEDVESRERLRVACGVNEADDEEAVEEMIATQLHSRTTAEWVKVLGDAGIVATAVCIDVADLPNDPRIVGLLERVEDACWVPSAPWQFRAKSLLP